MRETRKTRKTPKTPKTREMLKLSVQKFFDDICPRVLAVQAAEARALGGSLGFRVFGDDGGAWLVDLGKATVEPRLAFDADAFIELRDTDLLGMLEGKLELAEAIGDGRIRCRGDVSVLVKLGALLETAEG